MGEDVVCSTVSIGTGPEDADEDKDDGAPAPAAVPAPVAPFEVGGVAVELGVDLGFLGGGVRP